MAKPPPEESFNVTFRNVAKNALGDLITAGIKLGHDDVHYDLVTHIPTFKQRQQHDTNAQDFLKDWIKDHPQFRAIEAVKYFEANGRTNGAAYTGLRVLVEERILKKVGPGEYARRDAYLPKPKKAAKRADSGKRHKTPNSAFLLAWAIKNGGKMTRTDAQHILNRNHRNGGSISSVLRDMLKAGNIERVEEGVYKVLKPRSNGGTTEVTHG